MNFVFSESVWVL